MAKLLINIFEIANSVNNNDTTPEAVSPAPAPPPPKPKKSFFDIGIEIVGERCNGTRSGLIAEVM